MEEKEKRKRYRIKYAAIRGRRLILTLKPAGGELSIYRKAEYGNPEESIRNKMIWLYTQIFTGDLSLTYRCNLHDAAKWMLRYLESKEVLEMAAECDRRYGTNHLLCVCRNAADAMVHGGIWTNRDLERADKSAVLTGLSPVLDGMKERIQKDLSKQETWHAGQVKLTCHEDSVLYPGYLVGRIADGGGLCLAANGCVDESGWADPDKGEVVRFVDAPEGAYAVVAYGFGSHMANEVREYIQGRIAPEMDAGGHRPRGESRGVIRRTIA